jgi:type I restriction-modification system DNA methylase subunit
MTIFQKSVINKHLKNLDKAQIEKAYLKFRTNYSPAKIEKIKQLKEEEYQDGFLREIFVDVLGYTLRPDENFDLQREFKNQTDGKKADGAIIKNENAIAVIELKSAKTKDLTLVTQQAFNYKNNQSECKYVITSNFQKLRFYIDYATEYEEFDLFHLTKDEFDLFFLILSKESIFANLPLKLKEETQFHDQNISDKLYKDYSNFKRKLFDNLTVNHPDIDKLTLFKKSQKLLDRFLFILFAEDSGLLPPNSISRIIKRFEILKEEDAYKPLYEIFKQYFGYMNVGRKGKKDGDDIPAYNGGLFYEDKLLDSLNIDDEVLINDLRNLSEYDFNTEVDVNILGHIFEHSLSEIEEITAEIEGTTTDKTKSKRKKYGVFYTPKYITQYIVENTIGTLCAEKRKDLDIIEIEFDGTYRTKDGKLSVKGKKLYQKLKNYKDWLLSLKIVDPACGSGAFLNQALNFLIVEHKNIDDIIADLTNTPLRLFDTEKNILENNLYGVDINEESVEIAKLSLWLRTAQKGRKLSVLSNNIKCGNSLIDDPEVAGNKAFNWNNEFPEIMQNGGFDVVIGNPPYGVSFNKDQKKYLSQFDSFVPDYEIYIYFISLATDKLLKKDGRLSYIFPNTFLSILYGKNYRQKIIDNFKLQEIVDLSNDNTFVDASVRTCILTLKNKQTANYDVVFKKIERENSKQIIEINKQNNHFLKQNIDNWLSVSSYSKIENQVVEKIKQHKVINDYFDVSQGLIPYDKYRGHTEYQIKNRVFHSDRQIDNTYKRELKGGDIYRYGLKWNGKLWISYGKWLAAPRKQYFFNSPRLLVREITSDFLYCCYTEDEYYNTPSLINIVDNNSVLNLKFTLCILNSKLIGWYHNTTSPKAKKGLFPKILVNDVKNLPIKEISKENQQHLIVKADKMLELNQQLQEKKYKFLNRVKDNLNIGLKPDVNKSAEIKISKKLKTFYNNDFKTFVSELKKQKVKLSLVQQDEWEEYFYSYKTEINQLQAEINRTDKEIDQMVYDLYELTEEEIKIVEL